MLKKSNSNDLHTERPDLKRRRVLDAHISDACSASMKVEAGTELIVAPSADVEVAEPILQASQVEDTQRTEDDESIVGAEKGSGRGRTGRGRGRPPKAKTTPKAEGGSAKGKGTVSYTHLTLPTTPYV